MVQMIQMVQMVQMGQMGQKGMIHKGRFMKKNDSERETV